MIGLRAAKERSNLCVCTQAIPHTKNYGSHLTDHTSDTYNKPLNK